MGILNLAVAVIVGYGAQWMFNRRILPLYWTLVIFFGVGNLLIPLGYTGEWILGMFIGVYLNSDEKQRKKFDQEMRGYG